MSQKVAGTAFLMVVGIVMVTWLWGLGDDLHVVQTQGGHCQLDTGERFTRIEDRHNPTDTDNNDIDEYIYLTVAKYEVTTELPEVGAAATRTPYDACRILIPNPEDDKRTNLFPNIAGATTIEITPIAILNGSAKPTNQCLETVGTYSSLLSDDANPCAPIPDPMPGDPLPIPDPYWARYDHIDVLNDDGTPATGAIPNIRVADATWQEQPAMFNQETAIGRLIYQATDLYAILAFVAVAGVGLAFYFRRRRPEAQ